MIVAHFFLREIRKKPCLFVETTSSQGLEQPSPAAQRLIDVSYDDRRQKWVRDAYYAFTKKFPNLVLVDALENTLRLESDHPSFDLVFRPKGLNASHVSAGIPADGECASAGKRRSVTSVLKNIFSKSKKGEE